MPRADRFGGREGTLTGRLRKRAAGREEAAGWPLAGRWGGARHALRRARIVDAWRRGEEAGRVRMAGAMDDLGCGAELDEPASVHDADAVGEVGHHGKIVRDVNESAVARVAQAGDRVEHPHLRGDVEPGRRLVKDDNVRPADQRHHQDNALLLAARELVRDSGARKASVDGSITVSMSSRTRPRSLDGSWPCARRPSSICQRMRRRGLRLLEGSCGT